jgi:predicted dehydrogenase
VKIAGEVLVAGLGSIGERHVRNLLAAEHREIAVLRRSEQPARTIEPGSFQTITDVDQAFAREPAALIIATPSSMHLPLLQRAIDAGIPTMVEVPLASSLDGLADLTATARTNDVPVLIAHNLRFHPCLIALRESVNNGDLGKPLYSMAQFGEYLPAGHTWEDYRGRYEARRDLGGGAIFTSIHEVDHAVWLFGPVSAVTATTSTRVLDVDVEDTAMMILEHESGVLSQITLDFVQRSYRRWLQVVGSDGTSEWEFNSNRINTNTAETGAWVESYSAGDYNAGQSYVDELEHFARVIRHEEQPIVDLEQARHVLKIGVAAHESAATGRRISI